MNSARRATTLRAAALLVGVAALTVLAGCHARFKKHAPGLGEVRTEVLSPTYPYVRLGRTYDDSIVGVVVDTVQGMNEWELAGRIRNAVDVEAVGWALEDGVANSLAGGPPFAWSGDVGTRNVLQLDVLQYGIDVPRLGAQGDFTYLVRARIHDHEARRVYRSRLRCEAPIGAPGGPAVVFGGVNNSRQIARMSDGEIQAAFEEVAKWCGQRLVQRMRRHAR